MMTTTNTEKIRTKLAKTVRLALGAATDGESLAAWRRVGGLAHRAGLSLNVLWLAHRDDVGQRGLWLWPEVVDGWYDEAEED